MTERQQEAWSGVLLTVLVIGMLLGALVLLRLVTNQGPPLATAPCAHGKPRQAPARASTARRRGALPCQ